MVKVSISFCLYQHSFDNNNSKKREKLITDKVLISVGRNLIQKVLNLKIIGLKKDNKGRVEVNEKFQTS